MARRHGKTLETNRAKLVSSLANALGGYYPAASVSVHDRPEAPPDWTLVAELRFKTQRECELAEVAVAGVVDEISDAAPWRKVGLQVFFTVEAGRVHRIGAMLEVPLLVVDGTDPEELFAAAVQAKMRERFGG